jgi:hypothetical protein
MMSRSYYGNTRPDMHPGTGRTGRSCRTYRTRGTRRTRSSGPSLSNVVYGVIPEALDKRLEPFFGFLCT